MRLYQLKNKAKHQFWIVAYDELAARKYVVKVGRAKKANNVIVQDRTFLETGDKTILQKVNKACRVCLAHFTNGDKIWTTGLKGLCPVKKQGLLGFSE